MRKTALSDLEAGQQVSVTAPAGGVAKAIMVLAKKATIAGFKGGPMRPPPGAPAPDERRGSVN